MLVFLFMDQNQRNRLDLEVRGYYSLTTEAELAIRKYASKIPRLEQEAALVALNKRFNGKDKVKITEEDVEQAYFENI